MTIATRYTFDPAAVVIVEAPDKLWHAADAGVTLCGTDAADWPQVLHWQTRLGVYCGRCMVRSVALVEQARGRVWL